MLITRLLLALEVCDGNQPVVNHGTGNHLVWSDLTLGPSFKVKRWFTGFGELFFQWIQICIGSPMPRSSYIYYFTPTFLSHKILSVSWLLLLTIISLLFQIMYSINMQGFWFSVHFGPYNIEYFRSFEVPVLSSGETYDCDIVLSAQLRPDCQSTWTQQVRPL